MTTFLLIRHGDTDAVGKLMAGWAPGWHLNARGREQAQQLARHLEKVPIRAVYTSPLERAIETAEPIALRHALEARRVDALGELRVGEWQGLTMAELDERQDWKRFNTFRSGTRAPGGEHMLEAQTRMVQQIGCLRDLHREETVAVVSHGDPLRAVIAYFLGVSLDLAQRIEISPASVTVLRLHEWGAAFACINHTGEVPA